MQSWERGLDHHQLPRPIPLICCFGCSPKKTVRRRNVKSGVEIFVGFGVDKLKEHRRKLEKVLREQEKASMVVEKMVERARLNADAFNELLVGDVRVKFK